MNSFSARTRAGPLPAPEGQRVLGESAPALANAPLPVAPTPPQVPDPPLAGSLLPLADEPLPPSPPPQPFHRTADPRPRPAHIHSLTMRSHNINKQAPEAFIHSDLHKAWDISFYQELTCSPQLPFGWSPAAIQPKIFSSILPSGDEGACIVLSQRVAPYAFPIQSPCPGALCLAELHLPGLPRILLISIYAQPPRRRELEPALNKLFDKYPHWVMGGDFNAQLSHLDTNGSTVNRWHWLTSLVQEKKAAADTFRTVHRERLAFTRYKSSLLTCDTRIDLLLFSSSVGSLPSASLLEADIESADTSSDGHPIYCTLRLPCTPQYTPPCSHYTIPQAHAGGTEAVSRESSTTRGMGCRVPPNRRPAGRLRQSCKLPCGPSSPGLPQCYSPSHKAL